MMTAKDYLSAAFHALLRGDTAERDRLCELAHKAINEEERIFALKPADPLSTN